MLFDLASRSPPAMRTPPLRQGPPLVPTSKPHPVQPESTGRARLNQAPTVGEGRRPPQPDDNPGLWPDDAQGGHKYYDISNGCQEVTPPDLDIHTKPHAKMIVRSSWSEGNYTTKDACCEHLYCSSYDCQSYADSSCKQSKKYTCHRLCEEPDPDPDAPSTDPTSKCLSTGPLICGQDCEGQKCYRQENCDKIDGKGETDRVYVGDIHKCCVDYMSLNGPLRQTAEYDEPTGEDPVLKKCKHIVANRVTDYPEGEPAVDRGEFPKRHHHK